MHLKIFFSAAALRIAHFLSATRRWRPVDSSAKRRRQRSIARRKLPFRERAQLYDRKTLVDRRIVSAPSRQRRYLSVVTIVTSRPEASNLCHVLWRPSLNMASHGIGAFRQLRTPHSPNCLLCQPSRCASCSHHLLLLFLACSPSVCGWPSTC